MWFIVLALEISRVFHDQTIIRQNKKNQIEYDEQELVSEKGFTKLMNNPELLADKAIKLILDTDILLTRKSYGVEWLDTVQKYYDKVCIIYVFSSLFFQKYPLMYRIVCVKMQNKPLIVWKGPMGRRFDVAILEVDGHFHGLKSIRRFFKLDNYCVDCEKAFSRNILHTMYCKARCYNCSMVGYGPCRPEPLFFVECQKCLREYHNKDCYEYHKKAACQYYNKCKKCNHVYVARDKHVCGEWYCRTCFTMHKPDRGCFMKPLTDGAGPKPYRFCVYDLETSQVFLNINFIHY